MNEKGTFTEISAEESVSERQQENPQVDLTDKPSSVNEFHEEVGRSFTREDVNRARQQEKDKLYSELNKLRDEVSVLSKVREEQEQEKQALRQQQQELARQKEEEEMSVRELLLRKEKDFQQQLEIERQERERAFALFERERQLSEVNAYRTQQVELHRDDILPELLDLVSGETREQIDASINGLMERSSRILNATRDATQQLRRESTGARVTAPPSTDPLENYSGQQELTPAQIRAMSVEEYAQYRQALLGGAASRGQGLFS